MDNATKTSGGIGFFGMLTLVFIALKLMNYINWSWWLVLLPFYGPIALGVAMLLLILFGAIVLDFFKK